MGGIGNITNENNDFEDDRRESQTLDPTSLEADILIRSSALLSTGGNKPNIGDDLIYCLHGSDAGSPEFTNITRRVSKAVRKREAKDRNEINMRCWGPTKSALEARGPRRLERFVRSTPYRMLDASQGNGAELLERSIAIAPQSASKNKRQ